MVFGDDDPEDSWDANDSPAVLLGVLVRWVQSIATEIAYPYERIRVLARWVSARQAVDELRRRHASPVTLDQLVIRLDAIAAAIEA